jgi:hypothetical protein
MRRCALVALATAAVLFAAAGSALAAPPGLDAAWANGTTVHMSKPTAITNPSPNLLASAPPLYILKFPTAQTSGPLSLPSHYQPQCDPCANEPVLYHDHLLPSAPGYGTNGTAGDYEGPWRVIVLVYNPRYAYSPTFKPVTSDEDLGWAIAAGEFLQLNPNLPADDPAAYEVLTNTVLICPVVSAHA